jgi:glycosyltransferase involved in cell wall biosynthesis
VKNQKILLEACARKKLAAVFIGGADEEHRDYRESCLGLAKKLEAADCGGKTRFHFFGHQPFGSEFLRSAYAAAPVFALPSEFETFGISALEAMVAGCALVLSRNMAEPGMFPNARFVAPQAIAGWADALDGALRSPLHASPQEVQQVLDNFSWKAIGRRLLDAYESLRKS